MNSNLSDYDNAVEAHMAAEAEVDRTYGELKDIANYLYKYRGAWSFFTSPDSYRIGKITEFIPERIPYEGLRTPNNRFVQVYRYEGMGDYHTGMYILENKISYHLDMHLPTIESYRSKVLAEVSEDIYGLSEIAANGITVDIQLTDQVTLLGLTEDNVDSIVIEVTADLQNGWAAAYKNRSRLDSRRKTD